MDIRNVQQNIDQLQAPTVGVTINKKVINNRTIALELTAYVPSDHMNHIPRYSQSKLHHDLLIHQAHICHIHSICHYHHLKYHFLFQSLQVLLDLFELLSYPKPDVPSLTEFFANTFSFGSVL